MTKHVKKTYMNDYEVVLRDVTEVFESCGCSTSIETDGPSRVTLCIHGPTAMCPVSIFEEHVEKARELMNASHPDISFSIEVQQDG